MSDFVWRAVSVVCVILLSLIPFALTGVVEVLFGAGMIGGGAVVALLQIGRE